MDIRSHLSIISRNQEDQRQRVLRRQNHRLLLPDRRVHLVRAIGDQEGMALRLRVRRVLGVSFLPNKLRVSHKVLTVGMVLIVGLRMGRMVMDILRMVDMGMVMGGSSWLR